MNNQLANTTITTTAATGHTLTEPLVEATGLREDLPVRTELGRWERTTGARLTALGLASAFNFKVPARSANPSNGIGRITQSTPSSRNTVCNEKASWCGMSLLETLPSFCRKASTCSGLILNFLAKVFRTVVSLKPFNTPSIEILNFGADTANPPETLTGLNGQNAKNKWVEKLCAASNFGKKRPPLMQKNGTGPQ